MISLGALICTRGSEGSSGYVKSVSTKYFSALTSRTLRAVGDFKVFLSSSLVGECFVAEKVHSGVCCDSEGESVICDVWGCLPLPLQEDIRRHGVNRWLLSIVATGKLC